MADERPPGEADVIPFKPKTEAAKFAVAALCLDCAHRWIGLLETKTSFFHLTCPRCEAQDSFVTFLPNEYLNEL